MKPQTQLGSNKFGNLGDIFGNVIRSKYSFLILDDAFLFILL